MTNAAPGLGLGGMVEGYCGYSERSLRPVCRRELAVPRVVLVVGFGDPLLVVDAAGHDRVSRRMPVTVGRRQFGERRRNAPAQWAHANQRHDRPAKSRRGRRAAGVAARRRDPGRVLPGTAGRPGLDRRRAGPVRRCRGVDRHRPPQPARRRRPAGRAAPGSPPVPPAGRPACRRAHRRPWRAPAAGGLAGRLGVAVADAMTRDGLLQQATGFALTERGVAWLVDTVGVSRAVLRVRHRPLARPCLDWTERRPHLSGAAGAALCQRFLDQGWTVRITGSRALRVTPAGTAALHDLLDLDARALDGDRVVAGGGTTPRSA